MSRRLVNRSGAVAASRPATTELPEYQPPSCNLNEAAREALGQLSRNRGNLVYNSQLKEAHRFLGGSVGDLHERTRAQKDRLAALQQRREERGLEKTDEEEKLQAHVAEMEEKVNALTDDSERAVRDLIDWRVEFEDEDEILAELHANVTIAHLQNVDRHEGQNRRTPASDEDPDSDPETKQPPPPSTLHLFREQRTLKATAHTSMPPYERYALNNDYAAFKKLWHDASAGEDGPPLPDAIRWFNADGQPVMREEEDAADDDDIAVAREVLSINCPLTLRPMEQPYSNRKCKHTFEKAAILDYLPMRQDAVQCPQTGCSQVRPLPPSPTQHKPNKTRCSPAATSTRTSSSTKPWFAALSVPSKPKRSRI